MARGEVQRRKEDRQHGGHSRDDEEQKDALQQDVLQLAAEGKLRKPAARRGRMV